MNNFPFVSVIVSSYNHGMYIEKCLESIINQTYKNIQLIVIDDGSTDNSVSLLKKLQSEYHFILECQNNMGLARSANKALFKYATGKYVCAIGSDDFWPLNKIEEQVMFMEDNHNIALIFGNIIIVDENNAKIGTRKCDLSNQNISFESLLVRNRIPVLTIMVRTVILTEIGGYDESTYIEDWSTWLKIAYKYPIRHVNNDWGYYRKHGNTMSTNLNKMCEAKLNIIKKWEKKLNPKIYKKIKTQYESLFFRLLAKKEKREAIKYWPRNPYGYFQKNFIIGIFTFIFNKKNGK